MAFSPGQASGVQTALNTGGQVTMAGNTPMPSASMAADAAAAAQPTTSLPAGLFDAGHIHTLFHRIQTISDLLIQSSTSASSLTLPQEGDTAAGGGGGDESMSSRNAALNNSIVGPDVTMGAMNEDDVTSGYEAALALSIEYGGREAPERVKRTELAQSIVRESQGLRDAFQHAQAAIDRMEGGEMDIEEQEIIIELLQKYRAEQVQVGRSFGTAQLTADVSMG